MMKRIYISGPMSGLPALNFPAFFAEAARLRGLGYEVVNPAELDHGPEPTWHECMRADIAAMMSCNTVALLDGWERSNGAHLELHLAHRVGMEVLISKEIEA